MKNDVLDGRRRDERETTGKKPPPLPKRAPHPPLPKRAPPHPPLASQQCSKTKNATLLGRKLHWDVLHANKIEGTVFQELQREESFAENVATLLDLEQLKRVFAKPTALTEQVQPRRVFVVPSETKRTLFKGTRAQNIAIVLARLPLTLDVIAEQLKALNAKKKLTSDVIEKINEIVPLPEEYEDYKKFMNQKEDPSTLRDIEKQYLPLFCVPRLQERCRTLLCQARFRQLNADVVSMLEALYDAAFEVRKSRKFRALLIAVLLWGNFVNHGSSVVHQNEIGSTTAESNNQLDSCGRSRRRRGTTAVCIRTFGFTLPSLLKLTDFKTVIDPSITSLHYIVANMIQSQPEVQLHLLHEEMLSLPKAACISASALKESLDTLQSDVKFLENEMENTGEAYDEDEQRVLRETCGTFTILLETTKERHKTVLQYVQETALYFGDAKTNGRDSHEDFFKTLHLFVLKFQACVRDYQQNIQKLKDILVTSAKDNGIAYIRSEDTTSTKSSLSVQTTRPCDKSSSPSENGRFQRSSYRRASVGAPRRQNVVLSAAQCGVQQCHLSNADIPQDISLACPQKASVECIKTHLSAATPPENVSGNLVFHPSAVAAKRKGQRCSTIMGTSRFSLYTLPCNTVRLGAQDNTGLIKKQRSGTFSVHQQPSMAQLQAGTTDFDPDQNERSSESRMTLTRENVQAFEQRQNNAPILDSQNVTQPQSAEAHSRFTVFTRSLLYIFWRRNPKITDGVVASGNNDINRTDFNILDEAVDEFLRSEGIMHQGIDDYLRTETQLFKRSVSTAPTNL